MHLKPISLFKNKVRSFIARNDIKMAILFLVYYLFEFRFIVYIQRKSKSTSSKYIR